MKRIFTSFLMLSAILAASVAFAAEHFNVSSVFQKEAATEPTYQGPSPADDFRNRDDRRLKDITIKGATLNGTPQDFHFVLNNHPSQPRVYMDESTTVLEATAGDMIDVSWTFRSTTEWTHYYLYIDYNHDGVFNEENELVSYTYYSPTEGDGVNSLGETVRKADMGKAMTKLPEFQIPENQGDVKTRIRFKADWNSKNPLGNPVQPIGSNGGTMVDFTINIHGVAKKHVVNIEELVEGGYFTVTTADGTEITDGQEVEKGTELTINCTVEAPAYQLDSYVVNGKEQQENTFVVNGPTTVSANVFLRTFALNVVNVEGGSIDVAKVDEVSGEKTPVNSGDKVAYYDQLSITATPNEGYELKNILLNGETKTLAEVEELLVEESLAKDGVINVSAEFEKKASVEPTYEGPSASDDVRNRDDRRLKDITIKGATLNGQAQNFYFELKNDPSQPKVYMDESETVLEATAGDKIDVSWTFRTTTVWTHYYLYVDYNHDGKFNETDELVSYTYYSENEKDGVNSLGQVVPESQRGDVMTRLPQFQIPESLGDVKTRIRFKADWNSKNPLGNPSQSIGDNGGTMVDFTINIHAKPAVAKFPITLVDPVNGTYTVKNAATGEAITNGQEVEEGTELVIEATPNEGYEVKTILVNSTMVNSGDTFQVTEPTTIAVVFAEVPVASKFTVSWTDYFQGKIVVKNAAGEELTNGQEVENGAKLTVTVTPYYGFEVQEIRVNGQQVESGAEFVVTKNTNIEASFKNVVKMCTISITTKGNGTLKVLTDDGREVSDGMDVPEGTYLTFVATPAEGYAVKEILFNGSRIANNGKQAVLRSTTIEATFVEAKMWNVDVQVTGGGTAKLIDDYKNAIANGPVLDGIVIAGCQFIANQGFTLTSVLINGEEFINDCVTIAPNVSMLEINKALTADFNMAVTFTGAETGIGEAAMAEAAYSAEAQSLNIPAGAYAVVYNTAGQQVMHVQGGQTVSTSSLAHGAYIVRVVAEGSVKVIKFVQK